MWLKKQQLYEDFIWNQNVFMYSFKCNINLWVFCPVLMDIIGICTVGLLKTRMLGSVQLLSYLSQLTL